MQLNKIHDHDMDTKRSIEGGNNCLVCVHVVLNRYKLVRSGHYPTKYDDCIAAIQAILAMSVQTYDRHHRI